jgi:hypothetical protein
MSYDVAANPTLIRNSPVTGLYNCGVTISVGRSTNLLNMTNVQWVNFIGGVSVVLDTTTLGSSRYIWFVNTGMCGPATVALSNGGTVGGAPSYQIPSGVANQPVTFYWDGTNLT